MKTWFMHDFNCSNKDGFSALLQLKNGCELYGKFWLLQEYFYMSQMHKDCKETIRINESSLRKVLRTNLKRLPNLLETFRECLGIVSVTSPERFGNVYELTMPNSLIFIRKRIKKVPDKIDIDIDIKKESKSKSKSKSKAEPKKIYGEYKHVRLKDSEYKKLKEKFGKDIESKIKNMDESIELKGYEYKSHYLAILKWSNNELKKPVRKLLGD